MGSGQKINAFSLDSENYRYGFNAKEKDESGEFGDLTHYDYGFRVYNPAIARFLSVDPLSKSYAMLTPYQFASNTPIAAIDLDGLEGKEAYLDRQQTRAVIQTLSEGDLEKEKELWQAYNTGENYALATAGAGALIYFTGGRAVPWLRSLGWKGFGALVLEETTEYVFESITGIPVVIDPVDVLQKIGKSAWLKGSKKLIHNQEKKRAAEYLESGVSVDRIEEGATKTADFLIDGKKVEFKSVMDADNISNAGVKQLQRGTKKEGVEIIDLDLRDVSGDKKVAKEIYDRFKGSDAGKAFKGEVKIATKDGLITF